MVHKKSEYKLQFQILPTDLRKQIWQDNIRFREFRKSVNQAHHYWSYQLNDDPCICDEPDNVQAQCKDIQSNGQRNGVSAAAEMVENWVEPPGKGLESCLPRKTKNAGVRQVQLEEPASKGSLAQEVAVQTPEWPSTDKTRRNSESPELNEMMQNLRTSNSEPPIERKKENHSGKNSPASRSSHSPPVPLTPPRSAVPSPPHCAPVRSILHSSADSSKRQPPSRFSSLSKTSRKCYFEDRKSPPFAFYGWNDDNKAIGEKKTYNVNAPESEVYWPALRAQKRRREDIEKYLAREAVETRRCALQSKSPVNVSSIWMSEYQDKFGSKSSRNIRGRPSSAPLMYSPVCWRYS